jgi:transposase InsO family protein
MLTVSVSLVGSTTTEHVILPGDNLHAILQILHLPDSPHSVNHAMQEPQRWIVWTGVEVTSWVGTNGEVRGAMDAQGAWLLHHTLDVTDVVVASY